MTLNLICPDLRLQVGHIENNHLDPLNNHQFLRKENSYIGQVKCDDPEASSEETGSPPVIVQIQQTVVPRAAGDGFFFDLDMSDYEVLAFIAGISSAILLLICFLFYGIYKTLQTKTNRSESSMRSSIRTNNSE